MHNSSGTVEKIHMTIKLSIYRGIVLYIFVENLGYAKTYSIIRIFLFEFDARIKCLFELALNFGYVINKELWE